MLPLQELSQIKKIVERFIPKYEKYGSYKAVLLGLEGKPVVETKGIDFFDSNLLEYILAGDTTTSFDTLREWVADEYIAEKWHQADMALEPLGMSFILQFKFLDTWADEVFNEEIQEFFEKVQGEIKC